MHANQSEKAGMRDRMRAAYDTMAVARDRVDYPAWKRNVRAAFLELLQCERRARLLEIGAGPGRDGAFFAGHGLDVVCIDLSPEMIRLCLEKGLEARVMDVIDLRFPEGSFDAAYSFNTLLHVPQSELHVALREVQRVLWPAGLFFLGLYGGVDREGVYEDDTYEPKRFFSLRTDSRLLETACRVFDVVSFDRVTVEAPDPRLHFQSLILRKRAAPRDRLDREER